MRKRFKVWLQRFLSDVFAIRELVASHQKLIEDLRKARADLSEIKLQVSDLHAFAEQEFGAVRGAVSPPILKYGGK